MEAPWVRGLQTTDGGSAGKERTDRKSVGEPEDSDEKPVTSLVRHVRGQSLPGLLVGPVGIVTHECSVNMKSSHPETLNTSANSH